MIFKNRCCFGVAEKSGACLPNVETSPLLYPDFEIKTKKILFINIIKFVLMNKDIRGVEIMLESFNVIILITLRGKNAPMCHIADIDSDIAQAEIILFEFIKPDMSSGLETVCYYIFFVEAKKKYTQAGASK